MNTSLNTSATTRVAVPVIDHDIPVCSEVLSALPDPADADQAILTSVPMLAGTINFGDVVRLGQADELGVRPVLEVVVASGHVQLLAAAAEGEACELVAELHRHFPAYGLRFAVGNETLLCVSVHPNLSAERVAAVIAAWLGADPERNGEAPAIDGPRRSQLGGLAWG